MENRGETAARSPAGWHRHGRASYFCSALCCCETAAHTSSQSKLEANLCEVGTATVGFFLVFFLPRSTAVNPAPPTQPRSSHSQASLLLDTVRQAGWRAGGGGGATCLIQLQL